MNRRGYRWGLLGVACALCACTTTLIDGTSPDEAERLAALLDGSGIAARVETTSDGQARLDVADTDLARAIEILRDQDFSSPASTKEPEHHEALVPTRSEETLRRADAIARRLERSITSMPGIASAHVHIALPVVPAFANELGPAPRAVVLVRRADAKSVVDLDTLRRLVAGAVPLLDIAAVDVIETPATHRAGVRPSWTRIGPWTVATSSARQLRATLAAALALQALLALAIVVTLTRARRARSTARAAADGGKP